MIWLWNKFKKFIDFCTEYWKGLVAFILVIAGYVIGKKTKDIDVEIIDVELENESLKNQVKETKKLRDEHKKEIKKAFDEKIKRIKVIREKNKAVVEELSNNDEKLDRILQENHGLKKGE